MVAFAVACLVGCTAGLDPATLVNTPRILAIVAEPPEVAPGQQSVISVLAFDPVGRELTYVFEVCFDAGAIFDSDNFDPETAVCVPLPSNGSDAWLPAERTAVLAEAIDTLTAAQTGGFSAESIRTILATAGIPVRVQVDVAAPDGTVLVSGHKLVGITTRAQPTHNPPGSGLVVGNVSYSRISQFDCVPLNDPPVVVAPGGIIGLNHGDQSELWFESYPVYDFTGGVHVVSESAYYSWYATGGSLTMESADSVEWEAPTQEGTYRFWYVVRDGHLGTAACTFELDVVAGDGV